MFSDRQFIVAFRVVFETIEIVDGGIRDILQCCLCKEGLVTCYKYVFKSHKPGDNIIQENIA